MEEGEVVIPPEPPPFKHGVDYVIRTWLEHKIHHTYPEPGGYNDQDEDLMDDWHTVNMYYSRLWHGVSVVMVMPEHGTPIEDLTKG